MMSNYSTPAQVLKRQVCIDAIKKVANQAKGNFEIPMLAIQYIEYGNRLRKKPVRVSYDYMRNLVYEMLNSCTI